LPFSQEQLSQVVEKGHAEAQVGEADYKPDINGNSPSSLGM